MQQKYEYTHHLPYNIRNQLCNLLDVDQSWRQLGGKLGMSATQLSLLGQAYMRFNGTPANELLNKLDSSNIRIHDLCKCLSEIEHRRAIELLKPYDIQSDPFNDASIKISDMDGTTTLVTPTPSFLNCNNSSGVDDSYMQLMSTTCIDDATNRDILLTPQISTWVSRENQDKEQEPLPIISMAESDLQEANLQDCHKQQHIQQISMNQCFNSSPKMKKNGDEDKIRFACATNKQRTSLTDCEIVNQLRLIMQINYKELKVASDNFSTSNIIGNGGFASVYRGNLKGTEVAIKRLKCNLVDQALNELTIMNSYRIDNILPIYGISIDGPEACLVYQYMSNGSLEDRLTCKGDTPPLSWKQRALIGEGIAKSLYYLHTLRDKPLVHGDVKSANVLLDAQFVPKLGDFGLARQVFKGIKGKEMLTHCTVSSINGTSVYLPAEYLRHRILSPAVDVYSYGIVLLEMGTGKRAYDGKRLLIDRVEDETSSISSGQIDLTLKDHRLQDNTQDGLKIWYELMIKLGLDCAHRIKKKRPDMGMVLARYAAFRKENNQRLDPNSERTPSPNSVASNMLTNANSHLIFNDNDQHLEANNVIGNPPQNFNHFQQYNQQYDPQQYELQQHQHQQPQQNYDKQLNHQDNNRVAKFNHECTNAQQIPHNLKPAMDPLFVDQYQTNRFYLDANAHLDNQQNMRIIRNGSNPIFNFAQNNPPNANPQHQERQSQLEQTNDSQNNGLYQVDYVDGDYIHSQNGQYNKNFPIQQNQPQQHESPQTAINGHHYATVFTQVENPILLPYTMNADGQPNMLNNKTIAGSNGHNNNESPSPDHQVDAMIPLLTELGIETELCD